MKTYLTRESGWNPFFIAGFYELGKISFFDEGKIIATINNGWFEKGNNRFYNIELPFEIKDRRKENLNRKEAFILSYKDYGGKRSHLFIHVSLLENFKIEKNILEYKTDTEDVFRDVITFNVNGTKEVLFKSEDGTIKRDKKQGIFEIKSETNYNFIKNDFGKTVQSIQEKAKEVEINLSSYNIEKLLTVFNITIK